VSSIIERNARIVALDADREQCRRSMNDLCLTSDGRVFQAAATLYCPEILEGVRNVKLSACRTLDSDVRIFINRGRSSHQRDAKVRQVEHTMKAAVDTQRQLRMSILYSNYSEEYRCVQGHVPLFYSKSEPGGKPGIRPGLR